MKRARLGKREKIDDLIHLSFMEYIFTHKSQSDLILE